MNIIKTLGFAAVAALSLGVGAAMAQEGPNDTVSGAAFFGNRAQPQVVHPGVPSGSSDVDNRPAAWHPGEPFNNEGGQG
jgi:hypothetical protein